MIKRFRVVLLPLAALALLSGCGTGKHPKGSEHPTGEEHPKATEELGKPEHPEHPKGSEHPDHPK